MLQKKTKNQAKNKEEKKFTDGLLRERDGRTSPRKILVLLFAFLLVSSVIAEQAFGLKLPEYMLKELVNLLKLFVSELPD